MRRGGPVSAATLHLRKSFEVGRVLQALYGRAKIAGFEVLRFERGQAADTEFWRVLPAEMELAGPSRGLVDLIGAMGRLPGRNTLEQLHVQPANGGTEPGTISVKATVNVLAKPKSGAVAPRDDGNLADWLARADAAGRRLEELPRQAQRLTATLAHLIECFCSAEPEAAAGRTAIRSISLREGGVFEISSTTGSKEEIARVTSRIHASGVVTEPEVETSAPGSKRNDSAVAFSVRVRIADASPPEGVAAALPKGCPRFEETASEMPP